MSAVLNLLVFPIPIDVKPEVLGTRAWIKLPRYTAQLCFPRFGPKAADRTAFEQLDAPRVKGIDFLIRVHEAGATDESNRVLWGNPWKWRGKEVQVASLRHAVLRVPVDGPLTSKATTRIGNRLLGSFSHWFEALLAWVEVLTGQDLDPHHPLRSVQTEGVGLSHAWVADEGSPRPYSYVNPPISVLTGSERSALGRKQLRWAVKAASAGIALPPERLLVRDAWGAFRRGNYRGAVLDAATALETVVTSQLEHRLSLAHPRLVVRELLGEIRAFPSRLALLRQLGGRLPENLYDSVMRPRNNTIHQNIPVTRNQANVALASVTKVVTTHVHLPRV